MDTWFKELFKDRRRRIESGVTLALLIGIVWQYGSLAPRVIIVLSFWLSLYVALMQLPFLAGFLGARRFKPLTIAIVAVLPALIALGYKAAFRKDLFVIFYEEWLGGAGMAEAVIASVALPVLSYLFGMLGRRMKKNDHTLSKQGGQNMPKLISGPTVVQAAGNKPKTIEEFIGRVNSGTSTVSIARMQSPSGWIEPGQAPEFDEYTVVLRGMVQVESKTGVFEVRAGQAVIAQRGEWVRYSSPGPDGAEYVAVCVPAFSPESVHREG
jgi:mannose-6-phosphate isomerase-like protein (cupin superfamily)